MDQPGETARFPTSIAALFVLAAIALFGFGLALWYPHRGAGSTADSDLGLTLIGGGLALGAGGLVSYAVFMAERRFDSALRARDEARAAAAERTNLHLALLTAPTLEGIDLSGRDLSGAVLRGKNLRRADLSSANLAGADLGGADLTDADLRDAELTGARFFDAVLLDTDMRGADLSNAQLRRAQLYDFQVYADGDNEPVEVEYEAKVEGARYTSGTSWPQGFDPAKRGALLRDEVQRHD